MGPDSAQRSMNISSDPYAAAKFFHFVVAALIKDLFGIEGYKTGSSVKRLDGIFGQVAAYIGTVEAQGRGTLHLHMVLWLQGSLTTKEMKEALKTETFRAQVTAFIAANIRADLDGADSNTVVRCHEKLVCLILGHAILARMTMNEKRRLPNLFSQKQCSNTHVVSIPVWSSKTAEFNVNEGLPLISLLGITSMRMDSGALNVRTRTLTVGILRSCNASVQIKT